MVFVLVSVIGVAKAFVQLGLDFSWFAVSHGAGSLFHDYISMTGGLLLGFIFVLIFSGQLNGKKQPVTGLGQTPAAP